MSRKDIVLALANNDGGGHVDLGNRLINAVRNAAPIFGEEDAEGNFLWQSRGTEQERTIVSSAIARARGALKGRTEYYGGAYSALDVGGRVQCRK